ncbi:unnamed protein product [Lepeophtheirus salmonis]|uniref:(salmon louse) hypothetical protein n=1 Tax=Lepeophtheirus salmonis TaxID=72036 RepID=A0A7R8D6Q1_LEPSM|nr:unnamed protein product [Lepeophtheirus salmonis]CAF3043105.1 unnamed protein product [Lepeophtheirus salmonis]
MASPPIDSVKSYHSSFTRHKSDHKREYMEDVIRGIMESLDGNERKKTITVMAIDILKAFDKISLQHILECLNSYYEFGNNISHKIDAYVDDMTALYSGSASEIQIYVDETINIIEGAKHYTGLQINIKKTIILSNSAQIFEGRTVGIVPGGKKNNEQCQLFLMPNGANRISCPKLMVVLDFRRWIQCGKFDIFII